MKKQNLQKCRKQKTKNKKNKAKWISARVPRALKKERKCCSVEKTNKNLERLDLVKE